MAIFSLSFDRGRKYLKRSTMPESQTAAAKAGKEKIIKGRVPKSYVIFLLATLFARFIADNCQPLRHYRHK